VPSQHEHCGDLSVLWHAADLLADKGEEIGEAAQYTAQELRKPQNAALVGLGVLGASAIVAYPHQSFQFLGFLGLELTLLVKALSYDNPQQAIDALNKSVGSLTDSVSTSAASAGKAAGKARASKPVQAQHSSKKQALEPPAAPMSSAADAAAARAKEAQAAAAEAIAEVTALAEDVPKPVVEIVNENTGDSRKNGTSAKSVKSEV
jgi:hypothetical protein